MQVVLQTSTERLPHSPKTKTSLFHKDKIGPATNKAASCESITQKRKNKSHHQPAHTNRNDNQVIIRLPNITPMSKKQSGNSTSPQKSKQLPSHLKIKDKSHHQPAHTARKNNQII